MPTVGEIVRRLTPRGTLLQAEYAKDELDGSDPICMWREAPIWPPDMFAISATLVRYSECYAHGAVRGGIGLGANHAKRMRRMGELWQRSLVQPQLEGWRDREWGSIISGWNLSVADAVSHDGKLRPWATAALRLLAAADEASVSVGFGRGTRIARMAEIVALEQDFETITFAVDSSECSVQPKGRTPMVGCNLRSMSLHLALLPPASIVSTKYIDPIQRILRRREFGVI